MNVNVDEKKNVIVIELPLRQPSPSKSGKSMTVASTDGISKSAATYKGKPLSIGVNVFYPVS